MPEIDLGRLLRLKEMIDSAGDAVPADGASAPALTKSYARLREQIGGLVTGTPLADEFVQAFPEIEVVAAPQAHPRSAARAALVNESAAREARALLGQMAGWVGGLIAEQTLERRMQLEAAERVSQERRDPPGFRAE
jgi:hypothetical protein